MKSGVIQGSVLGPILFNIFVNDLDKCLQHCQILKYADDTRIFLSANNSTNSVLTLHEKVQCDIDNIVNWSLGSGLNLNIDKCFSVSFGRTDLVRNYTISDNLILNRSEFSDLGLVVQSPISFNLHFNIIASKAFSKLGLINKIFRNKCKDNTVKLFKAFVRPSVEYASIVWNPHTQIAIDHIQRVQRRMCRLIPEIRHLSYREQLKFLGLLSLRARRIRFQLITIFKIFKGLINIDFRDLFDVSDFHRTRGHNLHIISKFSQHNYRLHFFSVSSIYYWNKLSQDDVDSTSVASFKQKLVYFFNRLDIW